MAAMCVNASSTSCRPSDGRVRRGDVPRAPDRGAADPDAALTRLAGEKADRDVDLLWREATEQIGEEADLGEAAAGFADRSARCDEIVERHASVA